jgi:hypothetical protein
MEKEMAVPFHAKQAQRGNRGIALWIHDLNTKRSFLSAPHPGYFIFRNQKHYAMHRRLVFPHSCSGCLKILPPPTFETQPIQLAVSRYADCAIAAPFEHE